MSRLLLLIDSLTCLQKRFLLQYAAYEYNIWQISLQERITIAFSICLVRAIFLRALSCYPRPIIFADDIQLVKYCVCMS